MNNCAPQFTPHDGRQQARTHLFVLATIYSDDGSAPVHLRNMSPSGALIEGAVLPQPGTRISLKRGQLHATGQIAWCAGRRAGVRLDATVHVADWMARQASRGQQGVDAMISAVRCGHPSATGPSPADEPASVELELTTLRSEIAELGSALIEDAILVATHPEVQAIDISLQRIDRILERLRAGG